MTQRRSRLVLPALALLAGCSHSGLPDTPLLAGIERQDYAAGSGMIEGRLRARFPAGSSDRQLAAYLQQQGLRLEPGEGASPGAITGRAVIREEGVVCGSQVWVDWTADAAHRIGRIDVRYTDTGCP